jgi:hypothetical protein
LNSAAFFSGGRAVVPVVQAALPIFAVAEAGLHLSMQTIPFRC